MFNAWSRAATKLRWLGVVALLATIVAGLSIVPGTIAALEPGGFEVSGGRVAQTEDELARRFDTAGVDLLLLVGVERNRGEPGEQDHESRVAPRGRERLGTLVQRLRDSPQIERVTGPDQLPGLLGAGQREALLLVSLRGDERAKQRAFAQVEQLARSLAGLEVAIGGELAANVRAQELARRDLQRAELFALPIALLILLVYFRRPLPALLPVLIGGFAITGSFVVLRGLAEVVEISLFALNIVVFLGLGLAVDYSLFIVQRQREELAVGNEVGVALRRSLETAGKTVMFSGVAVIVSLLALAWVPISLLRGVALGGALVVVLANVGALLILPTLLALLGTRVSG